MAWCVYCGGPEILEVAEIWGHEFLLETCCDAFHEEVVFECQDPDFRKALLLDLGIEQLTGSALRRVADDDGHLILDHKLEIHPIKFGAARAFIARHHDHCAPPVAWRYGASIWNGRTLVGVICVGRPVARALDQVRIVEVNRLCVDRSLPASLRWNACSQLYGWAAREAKNRGFCKIITYTLQSEVGTTLRAAGWTAEHITSPKSWNSKSRSRTDHTPLVPKVRWARQFKALPSAPAPLFEFAQIAA